MKYNFDQVIGRKDTSSIKWDLHKDTIPLWVADMDFRVSDDIVRIIEERIKHPIFGYTEASPELYNAYIDFYKDRYGLSIRRDDMLFSLGVISSIESIIRMYTNESDKIVLLTPIYQTFLRVIRNNNRVVKEVPLNYIDYKYSINFELLEEALSDPKSKILLLSNPHNPTGNLWTKDELEKMASLCLKHNVLLISDEIHCDIVKPGLKYTPAYSLNEKYHNIIVMLISPSKTFNVAGIRTSMIVVKNEELRKRISRQINNENVSDGTIFSYLVPIATYRDSRDWLDQVLDYIFKNKEYLYEYIEENIPDVKAIYGDATYLVWVDVSNVTKDADKLTSYLINKAKVFVSSGTSYGEVGMTFIRINVATPLSILKEGLERLKEGINEYKKSRSCTRFYFLFKNLYISSVAIAILVTLNRQSFG